MARSGRDDGCSSTEMSGLVMSLLQGRNGTEDLSAARLAQLEIVFETLWAAMEPIFAGDSTDEINLAREALAQRVILLEKSAQASGPQLEKIAAAASGLRALLPPKD